VRGFTDKEKEIIRARLLQAGREQFARFGIRKTNVEELAKAAGISKGAFYLFYSSKEELFFRVLEQVEAELQAQMLDSLPAEDLPPKQRIKEFLSKALMGWQKHPFFISASSEDYQYLLRKMPEEQLREGIRTDDAFAARLISAWRHGGLDVSLDPPVFAALLRALVFVSMHSDDFDSDVYPRMMDTFVDMIAQRLVEDNKDDRSA